MHLVQSPQNGLEETISVIMKCWKSPPLRIKTNNIVRPLTKYVRGTQGSLSPLTTMHVPDYECKLPLLQQIRWYRSRLLYERYSVQFTL